MDSVVFDSSDLGRIEAFLSDAYAPMRIGSTTPDPHAHVDRVEGPDALSIDHVDVDFTMRYDVLPLGRISLCSVDDGAITNHRVEGGRRTRSFRAGEVFTLAPPNRPYTGTVERARYSVTMFDPRLLTELAPGRGDDLPDVRLLDHRPVNARRGLVLRRAIEDATRALSDPMTSKHALARQAVSHGVAAAVLHAYPTTADITPTLADREDAASSAALSLALDHIEAHVGDLLALPDLACVAGVTPRALQHAFRRHLDTTPSEYLRRVRLDRAHRDLALGQRDDGTTVTDVAMHWGFYHQGRFAAAYRRRFGEAPHETLQGGHAQARP